jgi:tetratricopeptide (TPR) repeat protein
VEFGESSLIPQNPAETLKRKYGDCKDKATLLVTMLRAAGIQANLALLNTGPGEDINTELPGMGMFDHAIVFVPASANEEEMWIDATAQYTEPGYLPLMDYGRWALIIGQESRQLKKIPEITSANHLHRETREFTMSEYGPAKIVETNEEIGAGGEDFRDFYTGDAKKVRENGESYVKEMYLADSLISLDHGDVSDLEKPFRVSYVTKGRRGFTYLTYANMAIRQETIFDGLPSYFYQKEDPSKVGKEDEPKQRTLDWWIAPFATEWHYKITAPPGFKLRSRPSDQDQQIGPARYTQKYTANAEGTIVEAVFRFDSGKQRLTAEEGKLLRDQVLKARLADPVLITFDEIGFSLLSSGKIKEGLSTEQQMAALHPKQALYRVRLADALLQVGMAERARAVAREATLLDPKSAQAFSTLGWTLEHDLIGRRLKKGFDYRGALAAYRKAKQLDPKDKEIRSNLGYLLEYDPEGTRYGSKAPLEEAIAEFKELKKVDEEEGRQFEDNVLYDLWHARKIRDVVSYAESLPASETRKSFILAATAAEQGSEAAVQKSMAMTTEEEERTKALTNAGFFLMRVQRYREAAEMLNAATHGQPGESRLATLIAALKKTKTRSQLSLDSGEPSGVIQQLFAEVFYGNPDAEQIRKQYVSKNVPAPHDPKKDAREFRQSMFDARRQLEASGLPLEAVGDIVLSTARYTKEGDEALGYHVTMQVPGAEAFDGFVTREDGQYRIVEFSLSGSKTFEDMGWEILSRLERKDLRGARQWLDWARERVHISADDDPLAGQPFPHFWTKGQSGDEATARTAALVLLPSKDLRPDHLAALVEARDHAQSAVRHNLVNLVLAYAYSTQENWTELMIVSEQLMKAEPDSFIAFDFAARACAQLKRFEDWDKLVRARLEKHPDEPQYIRSAASLALYRGDVTGSRKLLKGLIEKDKATSSDLNWYSWDALMLPNGVDQDAIEAAQRANDLAKSASFSVLHTLACLYADAGKATQAREVILKAMDAGRLEEPDSAVWFAFGKIAEQYGEINSARSMYGRVEKSTTDAPGTSYELAQKRLQALRDRQ